MLGSISICNNHCYLTNEILNNTFDDELRLSLLIGHFF